MPQFDHIAYPSRYNSLRLLGYDYTSTKKLCAITLVADLRRPVFADMLLAKAVLTTLLSPATLEKMQLRAFTLMPDHLHLVAGISSPKLDIPNVVGSFKSFTTQLYWKRSQEIIASGEISLPSQSVSKSDLPESRKLMKSLFDGKATLRPEVVELKNWPTVQREDFLKKHLWQAKFFDHVIRNDNDLRENLNYIAMNPVRAGYVPRSCFYPYTGFLD
jgi:REP element-mobilizing transposase RayT